MNTHVVFPLELSLLEQPRTIAPTTAPTTATSSAGPVAPTTAPGASKSPTAWEELDPRLGAPRRFELFGVVEHSGTYKDGHYVAYVRSAGADGASPHSHSQWNLFSDTKVTPASEAAVLSAQAFLLFYKQVPTPGAPHSVF